jgi:hypothetical protein
MGFRDKVNNLNMVNPSAPTQPNDSCAVRVTDVPASNQIAHNCRTWPHR